jgi:glycosyltransferase involved in cell wall biosynthesis
MLALSPMPFTILTPVRNGASTIGDTLRSVHLQSVPCIEHLVIDANSDDGTSELVRAFPNTVIRHVRERDAGLYDAMNKGIGLARGDIIGIVNADDRLLPGAIEAVQRAMQDSNVEFVYGDVRTVKPDGTEVGLFPVHDEWVEGRKHWHGRDWRFIVPFNHPGLFVRRSLYVRLGGYNLSYRLAADHEFMCRLIANRVRGKRVHATLAEFTLGGASSDGTELFAEDEKIAIQYGLHPWLARLNRWRSAGGRRTKAWLRKLAVVQ